MWRMYDAMSTPTATRLPTSEDMRNKEGASRAHPRVKKLPLTMNTLDAILIVSAGA